MAKKVTEVALRKLKANAPESRTSIQEDGLRVEANPSGLIAFYAVYRNEGVKHKDKLGTYPALSVADAKRKLLNVVYDEQPAPSLRRKATRSLGGRAPSPVPKDGS